MRKMLQGNYGGNFFNSSTTFNALIYASYFSLGVMTTPLDAAMAGGHE